MAKTKLNELHRNDILHRVLADTLDLPKGEAA
jgi:hypothetical protein